LTDELATSSLESILQLSMTHGVGARVYRKLLGAFGSAEAVLRANPRDLKAVAGVGQALAEAIATAQNNADVKAELELVEKVGAQIVTIDSPDYPDDLKEIYDPPLVLYVKGDLRKEEQAIAIVGSRRPTYYGKQQAELLAGGLASRGWTVVAGLARGIDSHAHQGALNANGRTIAVLGSGLLKVYPREHRKLADQIAEDGAVISEFPMTAPPDPWNFPRRNRIISGLCRGVIIVEAARTSGSLITASWATEQNRLVFAVPGRVDNALSTGCHALIKDGAVLTENAEDVLTELGSSLTHDPGKETVPIIPDNLSDDETRLMKLLEREPKHIDDLIAASGLPAAQVSSCLVMLEIKKLAVQLPGKNFCLA
jgi:DNA processing protein